MTSLMVCSLSAIYCHACRLSLHNLGLVDAVKETKD